MLYTSTVRSSATLAYVIALTEKFYLFLLSPLAGSQQEDVPQEAANTPPTHGPVTHQLCRHTWVEGAGRFLFQL